MLIKDCNIDVIWKIFVSWLKFNNIFPSFYRNHKAIYTNYDTSFVDMYIGDRTLKHACKPMFWIQYAFNWSETKEGYEYWREKSGKWMDYIYKNEIKETYNYGRMFIRTY